MNWSPEHDVFCSVDGKHNPTARRRHIAARPAGCFAIAATARSRMSRPRAASSTPVQIAGGRHARLRSRRLAGPVLSPTIRSPTSCIAISATARSRMWRVRAGVAFSEDGKARAGMGVDAADFDNSGAEGIAITNFDNEMMALYRPAARRCVSTMSRAVAGIGQPSREQPRVRMRLLRRQSGRLPGPGGGQRPYRRDRARAFAATSATRSRRTCF